MKSRFLIIFITLLMISSCGEKDYLVVIHTKFGDMKAILYEETPLHKENFIKLVKEGFFDSLMFHRIIQGFMIQGGDPESKTAQPEQRLGTGGPGYTIPAEIQNGIFHEKGALSAARLGDQMNPQKASSGSQFYIVQGQKYTASQLTANAENARYGKIVGLLNRMFSEGKNQELLQEFIALQQSGDMEAVKKKTFECLPIVEQEYGKQTFAELSAAQIEAYQTKGGAPHLDGEYTVFGKVVEGLEVIDKIASQPKDQADRPLTDIRMTITLEELDRSDITKKYGYSYSDR